MKPIQLDQLPEDVRLVLAALGGTLKARRLHPGLVSDNAGAWSGLIAGHTAAIHHISRAELGVKSGRYQLTLDGPRWNGATWYFWPGELEDLLRQTTK